LRGNRAATAGEQTAKRRRRAGDRATGDYQLYRWMVCVAIFYWALKHTTTCAHSTFCGLLPCGYAWRLRDTTHYHYNLPRPLACPRHHFEPLNMPALSAYTFLTYVSYLWLTTSSAFSATNTSKAIAAH